MRLLAAILCGAVLIACVNAFDASPNASAAIAWLKANQNADGSFGAWQEHLTAAAGLGLWSWNADSPNASAALAYLKNSAENNASWFYGAWGEADIPGVIAYALAKTNQTVNASAVALNLLPLQQASGGFKGYYDAGQGKSVESSVDTASALLGLSALNALPSENASSAVAFLFSLQNADGSFNLTPSISFDSIYSLGPNQESETALALLALKQAGLDESDARVKKALDYLETAAQNSSSCYSTALAALVWNEFGRKNLLEASAGELKNLQNPDGGFADAARSSNSSNALDTGFAAVAMYYAENSSAPSPTPTPSPSPTPTPSPSPPPIPSPTPPPSPTSTPSSQLVLAQILFPSNSGAQDVSAYVPSCQHAISCFTQAAAISCAWYPAVGPLACPEVTQTCFVTAVNGVSASAGGYWSFEVNDALASTGVSCFAPSAGDKIVLRYVGAYASPTPSPQPASPLASGSGSTSSSTGSPPNTATPTPTPTSTPTSSPRPTLKPSPSPSPASTPTIKPSITPAAGSSSQSTSPSAAPQAITGFFTADAGVVLGWLLIAGALGAVAFYFKHKKKF